MDLHSLRDNASYHQFQQSLNDYIYFSPLTLGGASGRAVKIKKDLFLPFFCVVDPKTHDGQSIIRQIENLRSTRTIIRQETGSNYARNPRQTEPHKQRINKINSAFHSVLIIKNLHVYYRVSQEKGDRAPSIYIMRIRQVSEDTGTRPGLYQTNRYGATEKVSAVSAEGKKVYINGASKSFENALHDAHNATNDINSLLFYCPTQAADDLGIIGVTSNSNMLGASTTSSITKQTVNALADIFKVNKNAYKEISWYAEGEGVNLLAEAIKQVPGELKKHKFHFINPIANTAKLIQILADKKANFEGDFFQYERNQTALLLIGQQKDQLMQAIGKLPSNKNYDVMTRNYISKAINELPNLGSKIATQQSQLKPTIHTFVESLKNAGVFRK